MDHDDVGRSRDGEQPRHERKSHRHVVEGSRLAHPRSDEGRLEEHAWPGDDGMLGVQDEEPVGLDGRVEDLERSQGRGSIAGRHHPRLCLCQGAQ